MRKILCKLVLFGSFFNFSFSSSAQQSFLQSQQLDRDYAVALDLSSGKFASNWNGYKNSFVDLRSSVAKKGTFSYSFELGYRSDSSWPLLGNVAHAYYSFLLPDSDQIAVGRAPKIQSLSTELSLKDRSNHRVCYAGFDCVRGGPIGFHYFSKRVNLSLELVTVPDVNPTVELQKDGSLKSSNRWSSAPVQTVTIEGKQVPVRVSTAFPDGAENFFKPGLLLNFVAIKTSNHSTQIGGHFGASKSLTSDEDNSIRFVHNPNTDAVIPVANNHREVSLSYQNLLWLNSEQRLSQSWKLVSEGTYLNHQEKTQSSLLIGFKNSYRSLLQAHGLVGVLSTTRTAPVVDIGLRYRILDNLDGSLGCLSSYQDSRWGLLLRPRLSHRLTRNTGIGISAFLIQSSLENSVFGHNRGNDYIQGELRYVF